MNSSAFAFGYGATGPFPFGYDAPGCSDADDLAIVLAGFETVGTKKGFCLATEA